MESLGCPRCRHTLMEKGSEAFTFHLCNQCAGIWMTPAALQLAIRRAQPIESASDQKSVENLLREEGTAACPVCAEWMTVVTYTGSGLRIDVCPNSHGIWFDDGELTQVLALGQLRGLGPKGAKVPIDHGAVALRQEFLHLLLQGLLW